MNSITYTPALIESSFISGLLLRTYKSSNCSDIDKYISYTNISIKRLDSYKDYKCMGLRNHYLRFCVLCWPERTMEWAMVFAKKWGKSKAVEKMKNCIECIPTLKEGWVVILNKDNTLEYIQMKGERPVVDTDNAYSVYLGFSLNDVYNKIFE